MELYEAMNEKIADIIAIDGTPSSLYASAYIKDLRAENARLKTEMAKFKEFYKTVQSYYGDLDGLAKRLQDDYNGDKPFEQEEQDRLGVCRILDCIDEMGVFEGDNKNG